MRGEMRRPDSQPYYQALQQIAHQWDIAVDGITLLRDGLNHVFASTPTMEHRMLTGAVVVELDFSSF